MASWAQLLPVFSSQPCSSVLHFSFATKHPLWVRSCKTQLSSVGGRLAQLSWILRKLVPDVLFWHSVMGWLLNTSLWPSAVVLCSVVASPLTSLNRKHLSRLYGVFPGCLIMSELGMNWRERQTDGQHVIKWEPKPFPVTQVCKPCSQTTGQARSQEKESTCCP